MRQVTRQTVLEAYRVTNKLMEARKMGVGYWLRTNDEPLVVDRMLEGLSLVLADGEVKEILDGKLAGPKAYYIKHDNKRYYLSTLIAGEPPTDDWIDDAAKAILFGEPEKVIGNFDIFEDRVKSLLERWRKFADKHPEIDQAEIVRSCMLEINDGITKSLSKGSE